ncbi:hypothetical protein LR48_Vigan05g126200 [Vigna angularis]|uniref:Transposase (putative) gypsy type domain-containing protein n=1 Tax=Phaseolus angularis TaxID=3914 RepID=A0A0L9UM65_PHAAN|nr:hypothetical protein LR48_Vigan05g126200 [Vigna angularis]
MSIVRVSSSDELTGRGGGESSDWSRSSSPSSVSSSYLERPEQEGGSGSKSSASGGEMDINEISLFLLQGGVVIDAEPAGGWLVIGGYDWASHEVGSYEPDFSTREELRLWAERSYIARDGEDARLFRLGVSHPNERVFHGKGTHIEDFFFVYTYLFNQMFVRVPFTAFQSVVLGRLNVAPSQLHPNGWACIQAFVAMCSALAITPIVPIFLHYFNVRPIAKRGWVSLTSVHDCCLFKPYSESFKNFKHRNFKVIIKEGGRSQFHTEAGGPLFPFYWKRDPAKINVVLVYAMTPVEIESVKTIDALSRRLPARNLLAFNVSGRVSFHMSSSQRAVVEPMSEKDITEAALEFARRGAMLAWYLREFADRRSAGELQAELVAEKKTVEDLQTQMEALTLEHQECEKKRSALQENLDETRLELSTTVQQLKDAQQVDRLADELMKANEAIEHEEGFNKALRQAAFQLGADPLAADFDIGQDVYDGKMMSVDASPVNEEAVGDEDVRPAEDDDECYQ